MPEESGKDSSIMSKDDLDRYEVLFKKLDVNKDGKIEVNELAAALRAEGQKSSADVKGHAHDIINKADQNDDEEMDFVEFIRYMHQHEQKLRLAFSDLDKNQDGKIEPLEVQAALGKLGITINIAEAEQLTRRIDKDGSLSVDWEEWRNSFQLVPKAELEDILLFWRQSLMIDIGELSTVPPEFTKKERKSGMWWRHLVAGGMAGVVSRTFTAPLDRLKIILQVHGSEKKIGIVNGFKHMIQEGGIKSLWRGNGVNCIKIAPESAIKFAAYEQFKKILAGETGQITIVERFAAGSAAGAFAQTTIYPMEVIKTRLAVGKSGQYKGMLDCGLKIYQREGFKALYRGYLPNVIGIIPYAGIDLTIYESLKQMYLRKNPEQKDPGVMVLLACGTLSSTCGQLASYPLALIRTRLQAGTVKDANFISLATNILKHEGFKGFYRGILPNFMKVLPAVSVSYVIYERAKNALGIRS